jgi:hypothetical protein
LWTGELARGGSSFFGGWIRVEGFVGGLGIADKEMIEFVQI